MFPLDKYLLFGSLWEDTVANTKDRNVTKPSIDAEEGES